MSFFQIAARALEQLPKQQSQPGRQIAPAMAPMPQPQQISQAAQAVRGSMPAPSPNLQALQAAIAAHAARGAQAVSPQLMLPQSFGQRFYK